MVPLQVVLAGGGGLSFEQRCARIFAEFDPPIVAGTYNEVSRKRRATNKAQGRRSRYRNNQSEHYVNNASLQGKRGVNSSNIEGASGYTEGGGFAYSVYDDQSKNTEHKFLTDMARKYEKALKKNPTLAARREAAKKWTQDMLARDDLQRTSSKDKRTRIKDAKKRSPAEKKKLAEAAAECLDKMAAAQFKKQKVKPSTVTRRGMTTPPKRPASKGKGRSSA
jgi:hypothetical protein